MLGKNWRKGVGLCTLVVSDMDGEPDVQEVEGRDSTKIYLNIDATLPRLRDVKHC
jgi:hypothetical protein